MNPVPAFLIGLLFGIGLLISGMTDPARVIGFLDVFGAWNISLAVVMAAAAAVTVPGFARVRRRGRTLFGAPIVLPRRWPPDRSLVIGSAVFGVGWGLAGICPGPSLVLLGEDGVRAVVFVAAVALGGFVADRTAPRAAPDVPAQAAPDPAS